MHESPLDCTQSCTTQAMMEPGENWIDETYERKVELGPLPGWELPLDWTTPDVTAEKKASTPLPLPVVVTPPQFVKR